MTEKNMSEIGRRIFLQQMDKENNEGSTTVAEKRTYKEAADAVGREPVTVHEILQSASSATSTIATDLYDRFASLSAESPDQTSSVWAHLTEQGRQGAVREHREQLASTARQQAVERYSAATATLQERLKQREAFLQQQLFGDGQDPGVLATLSVADDAAIVRTAKLAVKTNNTELRKAALAVASERNLGEVLSEILSEEEAGYLRELAAIPDDAILSRPDDAERVLPIAREDQIMPRADGTS
jgi:hypothetical protein